ncbi:hypothetical protein BMJ22_12180 [Sinorhizobium medicae]|nr:hypothetical protein BMJ22_12180 [Sinorhizobium medicae]
MPSRRETMWRGSAVRWWPRNRNYVADLEAISAEAVANNFIRGSGEFSPLEAPGPFCTGRARTLPRASSLRGPKKLGVFERQAGPIAAGRKVA